MKVKGSRDCFFTGNLKLPARIVTNTGQLVCMCSDGNHLLLLCEL